MQTGQFMQMSVEQFAADRDARITDAIAELSPVVRDGLILYPEAGWEAEIIEGAAVLFTEMFEATGTGAPPTDDDYDEFGRELTSTLSQTGAPDDPPSDQQVERIATWLAVYTVNAATQYASDTDTIMTWTTMRDDAVRDTHRAVDGQSRASGDTFDVGGYPLSYPGQPVGPPAIWMGCRCLLVPGTSQGGVMAAPTRTATPTPTPTPKDVFAAPADVDVEPPASAAETGEQLDEMPWHGVLAPEGKPTGDGRAFARESLRHRDLPLPLRYIPADWGAHDGSVVVGNITNIWRDGDLMKAEGTFIPDNEYALEAVNQLAGGYIRGVSVDLDDASMELSEDADGNELATLTDGRISAATLVPIPAFAEAYVALGTWDMAEQVEALAADGCLPCMERAARAEARQQLADESVSDAPWSNFTQADYDIDQWKRATVLTKCSDDTKDCYALPIREPDGTLNRNGVHAAAARFNQVDAPAEAKNAAAASLRGAYDALGEEPPDALTAALVFAVEVGDTVSWETVDGDGEVEAHTGVVESVDGEVATVRDGDDTYQVPVADLVVETDGGGEDNPFDPDAMAAELAVFAPGTKDGPGWITNPQDTQRLRSYWVRGEGAAKIRWGQPGDFNRCRTQLAKYITNPQWLAGTCANLHKVALGVWPGQEGGGEAAADAVVAAPFTIVASAGAPDGADDDPAGATYSPAPVEWFDDPDLAGPTPLQVTDEGRVFGHLATWGTCHIGIAGTCTTAPKSHSGYAYFTTGMYSAAAGPGEKVAIPVGALTLGTGHAKLDASAMATVEHYDNTGSAVAYVAAGEDDHGIWVAGTLAPNVPADKRVALQAATLSGDWRKVAGHLELVAALAVNVPGFPIPRTRAHSTERGQVALAAAGVVQVATEEDAVVASGDLTATVTSAVLAALDARDAQRRRVRAARRAIDAATDELAERRTAKVVAARDRLKEALGVS